MPKTENIFELSSTTYSDEEIKKEAYKYVCALLNSGGGKLILKTTKPQDQIILPLEQHALDNYMGSYLNSYVSTEAAKGEYVVTVKGHETLCTMKCNAYLPSTTIIYQIKSHKHDVERMREILNAGRIVDVSHAQAEPVARFVSNQAIGFLESKTVQFKKVKDEPTASLAKRLHNNRLIDCVSAFANSEGGRIYCGVTNEGIVEGQLIQKEDKKEIIKAIEGYIMNMVWPEEVCVPKRSKEWDISFEPVTDQNGIPIQSTYVVILTIRECPGGVFVKHPESYYIVDGQVQQMQFDVWKTRIQTSDTDLKKKLPRQQWSSEELKKKCEELDQILLAKINEGNWEGFEELALESEIAVPEIDLVVLCKWCTYHYRKDEFKKAEYFLKALEARLGKVDDAFIFDAKKDLVVSAMERSRGDHQRSYQAAKRLLSCIEEIEPCILTAESLIQLATMLKIIQNKSQYAPQLSNDLQGRSVKDEVIWLYHTAIQHLNKINHVSESIRKDRLQKAYIHIAFSKLGWSLSGIVEEMVQLVDIEEAASCLKQADKLNVDGHSISGFRKCHFLFAEAFCFHRKAQNAISQHTQLELLELAKSTVKKAERFAELNEFKELSGYARSHAELFEMTRQDLQQHVDQEPRIVEIEE